MMSAEFDSDILLENMEVAMILVDHLSIVRRVNLASETLFEQSRRYLLGKPLDELISQEHVDNCLGECLANNAQYTLREVSVCLPQRDVLVDMTLSMVHDECHPDGLVLIEMHSIDRISRFMREQNQLERQQSFRLVMRGLAHEIKNPLGGIRGAAQLLERELSEPSQRELTNILIKEADRLTRLVDRVMGSREQLKLALVNIHEVLEHVAHLVTVRSAAPLIIKREYDPTLPEIFADKEQLIQAVLNIVGNAIEAQSECDEIEIGFITQFERAVTVNQILHRRALKITIWDNGPGVAEDIRDILFDPLISSRSDHTRNRSATSR
jgi:two-component system nitrogen regulation sensor histidine kinase GlnL